MGKLNQGKPPQLITLLLKMVIPEHDREYLLGDYEFIYNDIREKEGKFKARLWYLSHVLKTTPTFLFNSFYWGVTMLTNFIKITFRTFNKQKTYTAINLTGLAIGMAAVIFILLWVNDELSYDRFHKNADRIYRISQRFDFNGKILHQTQTPGILASTLFNSCPEVENVTRVRNYGSGTLIKTGDKILNEDKLGMADQNFFSVFSFDLLQGDRETVLSSPNAIALSQSAAAKYFGVKDPIGKTMTIYNRDYRVSGIYRDMPSNSHFHLDLLISVATFPRYEEPNWGMNAFKTYALLKEGTDPALLQSKLNDIIEENIYKVEENYSQSVGKGNSLTMPIQKLTDIHLNSHLLWEFEPNGNNSYVRYLSAIAVFILLIALVNYINLSTARSAGRAKEVGIRKTVGSARASLVKQFLAESVFTTLLSFILTILLVNLLMPTFREVVGKSWLDFSLFNSWLLTGAIIAFVLVTGLLAGIYPSMVLSSFRPMSVLRGITDSGTKNPVLRNGLVVFQFAMSILLLIGSFVVHQQMKYSQTASLGFDKEQVLVIKTYGQAGPKMDVLRQELQKNPEIRTISASTSLPGKPYDNIGTRLEGSDSGGGTNIYAVDYDFLDVMEMEMVEGRFFSRKIPTDAEGIIINESEAKALGITDITNKRLLVWTGRQKGVLPFTILGIVKDFHYESFHEKVKPLNMILTTGVADWGEEYLSIRTGSGDMQTTVSFVKDIWNRLIPEVPFEFSFLDGIYNDLYKNEEQTGKIFTIFTFFAFMVSCLGLIGLTSFVIEQRKKEIGIRKVLGATVGGLVLKLSGEFTRWVIVANLIAWPLAYMAMNAWLQDFAYRVDINLWVFVLAALTALLISLLTVSLQSVRAAKDNPVESLKYE